MTRQDKPVRAKTSAISLRIAPELLARVQTARDQNPYRPSLTAFLERGLELAIQETEALWPAALPNTGEPES